MQGPRRLKPKKRRPAQAPLQRVHAAPQGAEASLKRPQPNPRPAPTKKPPCCDLGDRRRKAEAEAAAIRTMMSAPKKVLVAKKPEEAKPQGGCEGKPGDEGHAAQASCAGRHGQAGAKPGAATGARRRCRQGSQVRQAVQSSWAGDPAKKKEIKTRGDSRAAPGRSTTGAAARVAAVAMTATVTTMTNIQVCTGGSTCD